MAKKSKKENPDMADENQETDGAMVPSSLKEEAGNNQPVTAKGGKKKDKPVSDDEYGDIDINAIIAKQNKEFDNIVGKLSGYVVKTCETPIMHTGIPTLDVCLGGGIPSKRMSYFWGASGTGKTTLCFEIAYHNFLRQVYAKQADKYRYVFLDAEEGESKRWLQRIGINLPYKYDVPETIEDLEGYLIELKKQFSGQELIVIWDSVSATAPKMVTGRADIARATTSLLNHIKLTELGITFLVINQYREKQEQYAPPVPPAGNALRHKSHLTLAAPSVAKSAFWKDKKNGRSILWKTQKTRDSFNDVDFRLEMTYFSGFDVVLSMISTMRDELKIMDKRVDKYTINLDEPQLTFKVGSDKDSKEEFKVDVKDLIDYELPFFEIEGIQQLYNFFLTPESLPYWKFGIRYYAYQVFRPYFVMNESMFPSFWQALVDNLEDYYFKNWSLFDKTIPTRIKF